MEGLALIDISNYISLGILIFVLISVFFGFLYGLKRGLGRSVLRLVTIIAALVAAVILTGIAGNEIISTFDGMTVGEAISGFWAEYNSSVDEQTRNILSNFDGETAQHLLALPLYLIVFPIVFVLAFYVFKFITLILFWILCAIFGSLMGGKSGMSRIGGSLIGIVQGFIIAVVALVPVCGMLNIAQEIKPAITAETVSEDIKGGIDTAYAEFIDPISSSPSVTVISNVGAKGLYTMLTRAKLGGVDYNLHDESVKLGTLVGDILAFGTEFDWKNPEPWQKSISDLVEDIGNNRYISVIISGAFRMTANSVEDGIIEPPDEPYKSVTNDILKLFETSNADNLRGDLVTLSEVYGLLGKYDVLVAIDSGDSEQLSQALTKKTAGSDMTVVSLINQELKKNERTKPITVSLTKLSVAVLCEQANISGDAAELYEDVKGSINQVLTIDRNSYVDESGNVDEENYIADLTQSLTDELQSCDIVLDEEVIKNVAEYINENNERLSEITDDDINEIIFEYYDKYADYIASGDPADLPNDGDIPGFDDILGQ